MYQIDELVSYGTEGVCRVAELCEMKIGGRRGQYYVLKPVFRESATVYVPLDNPCLLARMRRLHSIAEIDTILHDAAELPLRWIDDANERRQEYGRLLTANDSAQIVRLIRLLYLRRQELEAAGKHLRSNDEQLLHEAEKLIHDELSVVLQIPRQDVPAYIRSRVEAMA